MLTGVMITDVLGQALGLDEERRRITNMAAWMEDTGLRRDKLWQRVLDGQLGKLFIPKRRRKLWQRVLDIRLGRLVSYARGRVASANEAFMIHDTDKRTERGWHGMVNRAVGGDEKVKWEREITLDNKPEVIQEILEQLARMEEWENALIGISPEVTELSNANIPLSKDGHESLQEKIVWFADAVLTGTSIVSINQRFDDLENDPDPEKRRLNTEFSDSYSFRYGGLSLYDVQRALGTRYVEEFCQMIDGVEPETFYDWLRGQVELRLKSGQPVLF